MGPWAVSLTEMEAAVPPHAALASCLFRSVVGLINLASIDLL